jgi:uncharacterized protein (UPF0548 family)
MMFWSRPEVGRIEEVLREEGQKDYTHQGYVRMTRGVLTRAELEAALHSQGELGHVFDVDHLRVQLGQGQECFAKAKQAMQAWKMFDVPSWLEICWPHSAIREGEVLGTLILNMGFYSLTTCRIVYTIDEGSSGHNSLSTGIPPSDAAMQSVVHDDQGGGSFKDVWGVERFGFAYGTLPCHLVAGEERFVVEWDKTDDTVWYEVLSFSKPQHWMTKLGYPIARWYQEQYHRETAQAMLTAIQDEEEQQDV